MAQTVPVWSDENHDLWSRLGAHDFGTADASLDFATRLAREHGWTLEHARGAIEEYRRFCFLSVVAGHAVTPSDAVDEVWHLHLTYTRDYWETFCPGVLRARLHHEPTRGGRAEADRHYHQYAQTLATYQAWFGAPPAAYWPHAGGMFMKAAPYRRVDVTRHVILPRPQLPSLRQLGFGVAAFALLAVAPLLRAQSGNPLDMTGPEFLGLYFVLLLVCAVLAVVLRRTLRNTGGTENAVNLDPWQAAYLAGGSARAVDAGIAELLARNAASIDDEGRIVVDRDARLDFPLDKIAEQARTPISLSQLIARTRPALDATLRGKLEQRGFMLTRAQAWRVAQLSALPFALAGAFGIVKILVGMERHRPVGLLILLVIVTAVITLALVFNRPERTRSGDAVLGQLRVKHAHALRAPRGIDVGLAVALGGTAVLAGTAYAAYHQARNPPSSSGGDSGSGCGTGGDSGGGGDGGGGGCGGCSGGD